MTKFQALIISLTLIGSPAVLPMRAQTNAAQQDNSAMAQHAPSTSSSEQSQKQKRQHAAHASGAAPQGSQPKPSQPGAKPQGNEMEGMPGMEGMQHQTSTPATPQQKQQSKPPQTGEPQPGQEMEGMQGIEGMQHGPGHKMKTEPLPPPVVPKLGMTQSMAKAPLVRLEELEQMALKGNPTLLQAATEIRSATGRKLQSSIRERRSAAAHLAAASRDSSFSRMSSLAASWDSTGRSLPRKCGRRKRNMTNNGCA